MANFTKGRPKHGGRVKGTPNKTTRDVQDFVDQVFALVDPIEVAERLLKSSDKAAGQMLSLLLQYRYGKPIQPISGPDGGAIPVRLVTNVADVEV